MTLDGMQPSERPSKLWRSGDLPAILKKNIASIAAEVLPLSMQAFRMGVVKR